MIVDVERVFLPAIPDARRTTRGISRMAGMVAPALMRSSVGRREARLKSVRPDHECGTSSWGWEPLGREGQVAGVFQRRYTVSKRILASNRLPPWPHVPFVEPRTLTGRSSATSRYAARCSHSSGHRATQGRHRAVLRLGRVHRDLRISRPRRRGHDARRLLRYDQEAGRGPRRGRGEVVHRGCRGRGLKVPVAHEGRIPSVPCVRAYGSVRTSRS